jgi:hypothetical protein
VHSPQRRRTYQQRINYLLTTLCLITPTLDVELQEQANGRRYKSHFSRAAASQPCAQRVRITDHFRQVMVRLLGLPHE